LTPKERADMAQESIHWYLKAANQEDKRAQIELGRQFQSGKHVKQDYPEAYKWFALANREPQNPFDSLQIESKWALDAIILKMSQEQIAEGQKRVAAFSPHRVMPEQLPEPSWVSEIKLSGLSGAPGRRLALINGTTLGQGETASVKLADRRVNVRCLEIREKSVLIKIEGVDKPRPRELRLAR
jgi:hypothetical protein